MTLDDVCQKIDDLEIAMAKVLKKGLGEVKEAIVSFAHTKVDRSEVEALRRQVADLEQRVARVST